MGKERFELSCCLFNEGNMDFIRDKKTNQEYVVLDELVPILNQQDREISELEEQLKKSLKRNNDFLKQVIELQAQLIKERLKGE